MIFKKDVTEYKPTELEPITSIPKSQRESVWQAMEDEEFFDVYVTDNTMLEKLKVAMAKAPSLVRLHKVCWNVDGTPDGYRFKVSKKCITIRTPHVYSDEEREKARQLVQARWSKT